jgi:Xaa-Pro aminopeptidase
MTEYATTPTGKNMDLSFLQKPHEWDPRRTYSTTGTDWQARVDFDRLRKDRLNRARMMMEKHDLGAVVCFVGENVRYITSVYQGNWKNNIFIRYCVLPRGGDPVLFETAGSDMECAKIDAPWLKGNIRPAITWKWAETAEQMMADRMVESVYRVLEENGVTKEKIGVDMMDPSATAAFERKGLTLVSAWPVMSGARVVKTPDEIECLKISSAIGDTSFWMIQNEWLKPGVTEAHITAKVNEYLYDKGFDFVYDIIVASGGNTSPYRRWHTDKTIRLGDLVIIDQNAIGPGGYFVDFVRTFKVGGGLTPREKDLYKECYESMYAAIGMMKAGNTTADVAKKLPTYDDD